MMFGLFAFIFKLSSRREMNRDLTGYAIFEHMKKIFPELDSIPHADTVARFLERTNYIKIEEIHIHSGSVNIDSEIFTKIVHHQSESPFTFAQNHRSR